MVSIQAEKDKTKKSEQTQNRIMNSYLLLMQEKNFDRISVKEIVSKARIARGTFYLYFDGIEELLHHIESNLLESFESVCMEDRQLFFSPCRIRSSWGFALEAPPALVRWFDYCQMHPLALSVLLSPNGDPGFLKEVRKNLERLMNRMMDNDNMPHDKMREYFLSTFIELNLLFARQLLSEETEKSLSVGRLAFILNTLRVGANCMTHFGVGIEDLAHYNN